MMIARRLPSLLTVGEYSLTPFQFVIFVGFPDTFPVRSSTWIPQRFTSLKFPIEPYMPKTKRSSGIQSKEARSMACNRASESLCSVFHRQETRSRCCLLSRFPPLCGHRLESHGFGRFDAEAFRRRLMRYSDVDLIKMGKACAPAEWLIADPLTKAENANKYELCRAEWRRRHPKTT